MGAAAAQKESSWPPADFRGGDNPADHPGMSRAPEYDAPTTIEVVRPERTIVRDVDQALPLILSGTALALVLASLGFALTRMRPRAAARPQQLDPPTTQQSIKGPASAGPVDNPAERGRSRAGTEQHH